MANILQLLGIMILWLIATPLWIAILVGILLTISAPVWMWVVFWLYCITALAGTTVLVIGQIANS